MDEKFHTLAVWCAVYDSWGSLVTSERREVITGLAERMAHLVPIHVRVITTATGHDDQIVPALMKLRRPRLRKTEETATDGLAGYSVFDEVE